MKRLLFPGVILGAVWLLTLPAPAFARGTFDPTTEFKQNEWIPIHLGPLNLSITKAVVYLMLASVVTILFGLFFMRSKAAECESPLMLVEAVLALRMARERRCWAMRRSLLDCASTSFCCSFSKAVLRFSTCVF